MGRAPIVASLSLMVAAAQTMYNMANRLHVVLRAHCIGVKYLPVFFFRFARKSPQDGVVWCR